MDTSRQASSAATTANSLSATTQKSGHDLILLSGRDLDSLLTPQNVIEGVTGGL